MNHNWDHLRVFLALVRAGSPEAAGRTLKIDESTVRRRLAALQHEMGALLIERADGEWRCTRAGALLAERLVAIERDLRETAAQLNAADPALAGIVRIGAPDGYGSYVVAPALAHLQRDAPDLNIELLCYNSPADIARREVDVLVVTDPPASGRYRIRRLKSVPLHLYASADYLQHAGEPGSSAALSAHTLVGYDPAAEYAGPVIQRLRELGIAARPGIVCSTVVAQVRATMAGAGLCFLPDYMIESTQGLLPVLRDELELEIDLWLLVHSEIAGRGRVRAVVDRIINASSGVR